MKDKAGRRNLNLKHYFWMNRNSYYLYDVHIFMHNVVLKYDIILESQHTHVICLWKFHRFV